MLVSVRSLEDSKGRGHSSVGECGPLRAPFAHSSGWASFPFPCTDGGAFGDRRSKEKRARVLAPSPLCAFTPTGSAYVMRYAIRV